MSADPERPRSVFPYGALAEIENAFVATLWHHPEKIPDVSRWLVPEIHFSVPHLRLVVNALARVYAELNATDWSSVIACLTELGQLEECGGREALDQLYCCRHYEPLFGYYSEAIEKAGQRSHLFLPRFSGGSAAIFYDHKIKRWKGSARIAGKRYWISAEPNWENFNKDELNLHFYPQ